MALTRILGQAGLAAHGVLAVAPVAPGVCAALPVSGSPRALPAVRAENLVHGSDQQCPDPGRPAVMITARVPAVRVPPDHTGCRVAAAAEAARASVAATTQAVLLDLTASYLLGIPVIDSLAQLRDLTVSAPRAYCFRGRTFTLERNMLSGS